MADCTNMRYPGSSNSETESGMVVASGWRRGNGEQVFNGDKVSVWEDYRVLKNGSGCTTM